MGDENLTISQEIIQIKPKTKYLSATELTTLRNHEIPSTTAGLKRTKVENTPHEQNELEKLYDHLHGQLSRPRIERLAGRAVGLWDCDKQLVRVTRKDGKFGNFGFSIDGQLYLEYYEALFLLEVNRLQLEYNSTILSIEQAYLLLMGEQHSPKFREYLVYSNLTRIGYILVKHQNIHFQKHQINNEADCVWAVLEAELKNEPVADYVKKTQYYKKVKQKYDLVKNIIKNQTKIQAEKVPETKSSANTAIELQFSRKVKPNLKRQADEHSQNEWLVAKRHCNYGHNVLQHSLVDFLKEEDEYKQFKEIFKKFDIVPLKLNKKSEDVNENDSESENETEIELEPPKKSVDVNKNDSKSENETEIEPEPPKKSEDVNENDSESENETEIELEPPKKSVDVNKNDSKSENETEIEPEPSKKSEDVNENDSESENETEIELEPPKKSVDVNKNDSKSENETEIEPEPSKKSEDVNENDSESENETEIELEPPKFSINFDVYLHNEGFRKSSPHLPNFRVIVLQPQQKFPTHDEIFQTHCHQLNPVPLLIVSVNDSKQMQAFLYYFS